MFYELRNMYQYEYITLLDTDEVIVPANLTNWSDLMEEVVKEAGGKVSWVFRNVYFFDEMLEREEGGELRIVIVGRKRFSVCCPTD